MKSVSGSHRRRHKPKPFYQVRDFDPADIKLLYQLYRLGKLPYIRDELKADEFKEAITLYISLSYTHGWTIDGVCSVFGLDTGNNMLLKNVYWHPKATLRMKVKAAISFFYFIKELAITVFYSEYQDKKFFELMEDFSLLRRVGTIYGKYKRFTEFQTRE